MDIKNKESIPAPYMNQLGHSVLLTANREKELSAIIRGAGEGQAKAIEELVEANLKLVVSEAYSYSRKTGIDVQDLISAGHEGLMKAVYKFDASFGTKFSTYAVHWIRHCIRRFLCTSHPVTIPLHIVGGMIKHKKMEAENSEVTDAEVMAEMEIDEKTLERIKKARITHVSLDATHEDSESVEVGGLGAIIADEKIISPDHEADMSERHAKLQEAIDSLDAISRDVVMAQCMTNDKVNLAELGKKWNVTGERIRQIRVKALKTLKFRLANINK